MASTTTYDIGAITGATAAIREDLSDIIVNIAPLETPFISRTRRTKATSRVHDWLTDTIRAANTAAAVESATIGDAALAAASNRTRLSNQIHLLTGGISVSDLQRQVNAAGIADEFEYQVKRELKALARDGERTVWLSIPATGTTAAGASMTGILATGQAAGGWVTTGNLTAGALTTAIYGDLLQRLWASGGNPDILYTSPRVKDAMNTAYGASVTKYIQGDASDIRINAALDVVATSYGSQIMVLQRDLPAGASASAVCLESDKWELPELQPAQFVPLAKTGMNTNGYVVWGFTLACLAPAANGRLSSITS